MTSEVRYTARLRLTIQATNRKTPTAYVKTRKLYSVWLLLSGGVPLASAEDYGTSLTGQWRGPFLWWSADHRDWAVVITALTVITGSRLCLEGPETGNCRAGMIYPVDSQRPRVVWYVISYSYTLKTIFCDVNYLRDKFDILEIDTELYNVWNNTRHWILMKFEILSVSAWTTTINH